MIIDAAFWGLLATACIVLFCVVGAVALVFNIIRLIVDGE